MPPLTQDKQRELSKVLAISMRSKKTVSKSQLSLQQALKDEGYTYDASHDMLSEIKSAVSKGSKE